MANYPSQADPGLFLPLTDIFDVETIQSIDVTSAEFKELIIRLRQSINDLAIAVNLKDTGYYPCTEFVCGQAYFPDPSLSSQSASRPVYRQVFRKVIDFGALPNATTKSVAHNLTITSGYSFTRIYGAATDPSTTFIPIPYASSTANENIELAVDATNVDITTGIDRTGFTTAYVVLEYIKS